MQNIIECNNLTHYYGERKVFENFSFSIPKGKIIGLLGKNGVGKSTTINILMGYIQPTSGECLVYGENSYELSAKTKAKIGLLHEGHIQYDFMSIAELEEFYSEFFKDTWKKELYYKLVDKLKVPYSQIIKNLSCGQRSQVVLGLIFAQDAELLILDDYSMGLDVGYRTLFLEYLKEYVVKYNKTVLITSHIMQDLEEIVDDIIILDKEQEILHTSLKKFTKNFKKYTIYNLNKEIDNKDHTVVNYEDFDDFTNIFSFKNKEEVCKYLQDKKFEYKNIEEVPMNFEKAFMGYTGKYE